MAAILVLISPPFFCLPYLLRVLYAMSMLCLGHRHVGGQLQARLHEEGDAEFLAQVCRYFYFLPVGPLFRSPGERPHSSWQKFVAILARFLPVGPLSHSLSVNIHPPLHSLSLL